MADQINLNLGDIQMTLFLPLWGRAVESQKAKPLLVDKTAVEIIDRVDFYFSQLAKNMDDLSKIAWIQRSLICYQIRLVEAFPKSELLFDVSSPVGVRVANKKVIESAGLDEKSHLVWGFEKPKDLLIWDSRIRILGVYHYFGTVRFGLRNFFMGILSDLLGIQYMLHLMLG